MNKTKNLVAIVLVAMPLATCIFGFSWALFDPNKGLGSQEAAAWVQAFGSIIAILVAVWVPWSQHRKEVARNGAREKQELESMLRSIRDEIEALWDGFNQNIGTILLQTMPGTPFLVTWPVPIDPFVIYMGYTSKIGTIQDDELRRAIIVTYARAQGLLLSFEMNNSLIEKVERLTSLVSQSHSPACGLELTRAGCALTNYGDKLRSSYEEVRGCVTGLLYQLTEGKKPE